MSDTVNELVTLADAFSVTSPQWRMLHDAAREIRSARALMREINEMAAEGRIAFMTADDQAVLLLQAAFGIMRKVGVGEVTDGAPGPARLKLVE